jgi:hypothetical protein
MSIFTSQPKRTHVDIRAMMGSTVRHTLRAKESPWRTSSDRTATRAR